MNHPTTIRAALEQAMKWQTLVLIKEAVLQDTAKGKKLNITKEMLSEAHDKALETALQDITRIVEGVIGENDGYNDMCEHCNNWDEGRNDLLNEQADRLRKILE